MVTVHYLNNSRAQRILFLLEELEIPYQTNVFKRVKGLAPDGLKEIHPLGKSPVITDGEHTIAESGAIIEYLIDKYDDGRLGVSGEPDDPAVLNYRYWLHYAEGTLMPFLVMLLLFNRIKNAKVPFFIKPIARQLVKQVMDSYLSPNLTSNFQFIEHYLKENRYFGGDRLTAADIQMIFPLEGAVFNPEFKGKYPNIEAYVKRIQAMPAYKRGLETGEPYLFA